MRTFMRAYALLALVCVSPWAAGQTPPTGTSDLRPEVFESNQWNPGRIYATARQPDGRMLVGGSFNRVDGGVARNHLLRLNRDGSLDAAFAPVFTSNTAMQIEAIAVHRGSIYVGGNFQAVNGSSRFSIAKLRLDGSVDATFVSPFSSTTGNQVAALAVTDAGVFVGGDLLDNNAWGLARLNAASGAIDAAWIAQTQFAPTASPTAGGRGEIHALAAIGGDLLVGGSFGQIAGVARNGIARISQGTPVAVRAFDGGITGAVYAIDVSAGSLYIGGAFHRASAPSQSYLNRLDANSGALDATWLPQTQGTVYALRPGGGMVYAGGSFTNVAPGAARLARFSIAGGALDTTWSPNANNTVHALGNSCRGNLIVGGIYTAMSGLTRYGIASFAIPDLDCLFYDGFETL